MIKVSVVIPAYNAQNTIQKSLETILNNNYGNFEVIIIDDKSTDNTSKIIERFNDGRLRVFTNEINSGPSLSRNYGIKKSKGEIILLLDADSFVEKDWIERHVREHEEITADIIGGAIISIYSTIFGKCDGFCSWLFSVPYGRDYYLKKYLIPTNNLSIKKSVFQKIGYFNEDLRKSEDAEFCFKALKNNLKIYFKPSLIIYHYDKDSFQEFLRHQEHWAAATVKLKKRMNTEFSRFLPNSYFAAYMSIFPFAIFYTFFIVTRWIRYRPSVLLCVPIIFLGKIRQAIAIKNSFKQISKGRIKDE